MKQSIALPTSSITGLSSASDSLDPVVVALVDEATAAGDTIGILLTGSRSVGRADAASDYDILWVLSDAAFDQHVESGAPLSLKNRRVHAASVDILYTCPRRFAWPIEPAWQTFMYATGQVLLDKTGELKRAVHALSTMPEDKARADVAGWFDAYLNASYRSLKAWRRGDELAGRLCAADAVQHVVRLLFTLEWSPGYLMNSLRELTRTGSPARQQELAARIETVLRQRGFSDVVDDVLARWGEEVQIVRSSSRHRGLARALTRPRRHADR